MMFLGLLKLRLLPEKHNAVPTALPVNLNNLACSWSTHPYDVSNSSDAFQTVPRKHVLNFERNIVLSNKGGVDGLSA